jgi:hypothetical protein
MFEKLKNKVTSIFTGSKPTVAPTTNFNSFMSGYTKPKPAAPAQTQMVNQPQKPAGLYPQKPTQVKPTVAQTQNAFVGPTRPMGQNTTYSNQAINDQAMNQMTTNDFKVAPNPTVKASALSPNNTPSSLQQARTAMETQLASRFQPNDTLKQLGDVRLEAAKLTEQYDKEYKALRANPEGKLSSNLDAQLRTTKEKQNEQLGYLALREAALTGTLQLGQTEQKNLIDGIKQISDLTNSSIVGGLQRDDVTGEISGFFKDPSNGQITQQIVGSTTPTRDLTYEKIDGQLVAIDKQTGQEVKRYGGGTGGDPIAFANEIDAYANQYAATGQKPTGLPEGVTFGMIAQRAADMPKFEGAVVSKNTNVTPSNVPAAYTEGIATTANLAKNLLPKMLSIYPKLVTGGGITGIKTQDRIDYETYARTFLSDLLKAKSGQAVTEDEYNRYAALMPKNLDQLTGNGVKKLNSLNDIINSDLQTKLDTKGLSIYGYSEVDIAGKKVKVGDNVDIKGQPFRANPNGTLTPLGDFNSAGNASASTQGNRPQRNNNPGNIKQGGLADKYATGVDDQGHLVFPDSNTGFQAMQEDISAKVNGQSRFLPANPTIAQLGKVYAEDPNWSTSVARILGVSPSTPTQSVSLQALTKAIAQQEGFYA